MTVSALSGVFREFTLTYKHATGDMTTDPNGNPIPETEDAELVVNFEAYRTPQIQLMEGADPKVVRGRGSCISPATMPSEIKPGTELKMTWSGMSGKLRILQVSDAPLEVLDEVLGQEFIAEWRAT